MTLDERLELRRKIMGKAFYLDESEAVEPEEDTKEPIIESDYCPMNYWKNKKKAKPVKVETSRVDKDLIMEMSRGEKIKQVTLPLGKVEEGNIIL